MQKDAQQARYLRKKYAQQGYDQDQQDEQKQFGKNLQDALQAYGKKSKNKNIQSQIQYFGNVIQPFNMRDQQGMGNIDQQGYFVFKRKNQYRDAWLDSIEEGNDLMVADKIKKKIKTQGLGYKGIYDEDKLEQNQKNKINQADEDEQNQDQNQQEQEQSKQEEQQPQQEQQAQTTLQPTQIKMLLCQLLPQNKSANAYIKQLKKNMKKDQQSKQMHDKILQLCNLYIQKTNEYDILTLKKQQLEMEIGSDKEEKSEELNWDEDAGEQQQEKDKMGRKQVGNNNVVKNGQIKSKEQMNKNSKMDKQQQNNQDYQNDDIF